MSTESLEDLIQQDVETFRLEVLQFLEEHKIGQTYFGLKAASNPRLVERLRNGEGVTRPTIRKVRAFMDAAKSKRVAGNPTGPEVSN